jgi:hypothetical protein
MGEHSRVIVAIDENGDEALYVDGELRCFDGYTVDAYDIAEAVGNATMTFAHVAVSGTYGEDVPWPARFDALCQRSAEAGGDRMIEPSDQERAALPECSAAYMAELEAEVERLRAEAKAMSILRAEWLRDDSRLPALVPNEARKEPLWDVIDVIKITKVDDYDDAVLGRGTTIAEAVKAAVEAAGGE